MSTKPEIPPVDDHTRDLWIQAGVMVRVSTNPMLPEYASVSDRTAWAGRFAIAQATTFAALVQMDLANQIRNARQEASQP